MSSKKKEEIEQVDETPVEDTKKYGVLLKFVNKLLENIGKDEIGLLTDFKVINRKDILTTENDETLDGMTKELLKHFDKRKSGYYHNKTRKGRVINILKGLCKQVDHKLKATGKEVYIELDNGERARKSATYYSIVK